MASFIFDGQQPARLQPAGPFSHTKARSTGKTCSKKSHVPAVLGPSAQPGSVTSLGTSPATLHSLASTQLFLSPSML